MSTSELTNLRPTGQRPAMRPAMRDSMIQPFSSKGGVAPPASTGPLQVDGFPILVDTFQIIFA